jgi:hypothetical protein
VGVPAELLDELRALARKYGALVLIEGCSDLVKTFAMKGMTAELAEKKGTAERCPRCRARDAALEDARRVLRRTHSTRPQGGGSTTEE